MAPKEATEKPPNPLLDECLRAFTDLKQCFEVIREHHAEPWAWHEYLTEELFDATEAAFKAAQEQNTDAETGILKPQPRRHVDRMKSHLLALTAELHRATHAADMCFFHMSVSPEFMKECAILMGTAAGVDEDMLMGGEVSPQKLLAQLSIKHEQALRDIAQLQDEVQMLKETLIKTRFESEDRWIRWQRVSMFSEEVSTKLQNTEAELTKTLDRERELQADYDFLYAQWVRASRMMIYKGRQMMRDQIFKQNKAENLFYAFQGFMYVLQTEKEERIRKEWEEHRDAVEFALRNEVKLLSQERTNHFASIKRLTTEVSGLKNSRVQLARRILYKHRRPYEDLEYCLWVWELWTGVRARLALEKSLETEQAVRDALSQNLAKTASQIPMMCQTIDQLKSDLAMEVLAHDLSRRELTVLGAARVSNLIDQLWVHRVQELAALRRIHEADVENMNERIAVLEREIAEDKHIHALKRMVIDLETNMRRLCDRRKVRPFVVPQGTGPKCPVCSKESLFKTWTVNSSQELARSASEGDFSTVCPSSMLSPPGPLGPLAPPTRSFSPQIGSSTSLTDRSMSKLFPPSNGSTEKKATYSPIWR